MRTNLLRDLQERELGARQLWANVRRSRARAIELSKYKDVNAIHRSTINSLQIDPVESRYLLAGASDCTIAAYDIVEPTEHSDTAKHEAVFGVSKEAPKGHKYAVSSVQWYPVDTGIFVTGSFDHCVNVWDANTLEVQQQFKMTGKVYAVSMSPISTSHMLIAAATDDSHVRLCDISSGAFTHTLSGLRGAMRAVRWSASSEWVVISGSCDGSIRLWDIRRAGCFFVFDSTNSMQEEAAKRVHPGLATNSNLATAHYGEVIALEPTPDGHYLISAGSDSRVKMWDMATGCNTLVNYEATSRLKCNQIAVCSDAALVYVPCGQAIHVYDMWSGNLYQKLRGHYSVVQCCVYNSQFQELYSGSKDERILVWTPPISDSDDAQKKHTTTADEDAWSD